MRPRDRSGVVRVGRLFAFGVRAQWTLGGVLWNSMNRGMVIPHANAVMLSSALFHTLTSGSRPPLVHTPSNVPTSVWSRYRYRLETTGPRIELTTDIIRRVSTSNDICLGISRLFAQFTTTSSNTKMSSTFLRPIFRTSAFRNPSLILRTGFKPTPLARPATLLRPTVLSMVNPNAAMWQVRSVASSVSNKPGSQTLEHAATNIKEELGNSATDLAKKIAGSNLIVDRAGDSFVSISSCCTCHSRDS